MIYFGIVLAVMSVAAFVLYGSDKAKAKRGAWRISEKVLLSVSFFGGSVGGLAGMLLFRHKTRHWYFWAVNLLGLFWQAGLFASLILRGLSLIHI